MAMLDPQLNVINAKCINVWKNYIIIWCEFGQNKVRRRLSLLRYGHFQNAPFWVQGTPNGVFHQKLKTVRPL